MNYRVPFIDPKEHYRKLKAEIDFAFTDTLSKGDLVLRRQLRDFEQNLANYCGTKYAVGVNSCYHALYFSLLAAGVGAGDEVITVGHTFAATVSAIVHTGAKPVLVDVGKDHNMCPAALEKAVTARSKAVIPVHLNGRVCRMDLIMDVADRHNLKVIEDAAQALGASQRTTRAGAFGLAGCFSFYPFKSLGGIGDGGAVVTNDRELARFVTLMRFNGEDRETGEFFHHGYTALLGNVNAAILDVKLRHFGEFVEQRRKIARLYHDGFAAIKEITRPVFDGEGFFDTFQNYVIRSRHRDELRAYLRDNGVETLVHWATPMWKYPGLGLSDPNLEETEAICREVISLPMSAETTAEQVTIVLEVVEDFFRTKEVQLVAASSRSNRSV